MNPARNSKNLNTHFINSKFHEKKSKISNGVSNTEKKYIKIMRRKSGEDRLKIAIGLRKMVLKLAEAEIKNQKPKISKEEIKKLIFKRIYGSNFNFETGGK